MEWKTKLSQLTADNGAIKEIADLIRLQTYDDPALEQFFTTMRNVHNGDKLGFLGEMQDIATAGGGCSLEYVNPNINVSEKTWAIGKYVAPLYWCYTEFEGTLAEKALKNGTDIADLTGTDIVNMVIVPTLVDAIKRAYWRIIWFGDTSAKTIANSGVLTNGTTIDLFKVTDGLFKQLFAIATANASQKTAISANSQSTYATQKSNLLGSGVATDIVEKMLMDADSRIASLDGASIYMTKSLADALAYDMKHTYKDTLDWQDIYNGVRVTKFNGVNVVSVGIWDRIINQYQNDGTKWNLPHRAVFTAPSQLLVGTPAQDVMSDFNIFYDPKDSKTYAKVEGKVGTLVGEDALVQVAF